MQTWFTRGPSDHFACNSSQLTLIFRITFFFFSPYTTLLKFSFPLFSSNYHTANRHKHVLTNQQYSRVKHSHRQQTGLIQLETFNLQLVLIVNVKPYLTAGIICFKVVTQKSAWRSKSSIAARRSAADTGLTCLALMS